MAKNPFKTAQALEIQRLLQELLIATETRKHIMADILAEAGLIPNTPSSKYNWRNNKENNNGLQHSES
jgi:hypothetical protein